MDLPTLDDIIARIEDFCARHEMKPSRFGREATNNPALLNHLRAGGNPTLETMQRIADFMAARDGEADAARDAA
jgi:hypothetical protein